MWKTFCPFKNTQSLSPSRLKQLTRWQAGFETARCQLFYYDISEKRQLGAAWDSASLVPVSHAVNSVEEHWCGQSVSVPVF